MRLLALLRGGYADGARRKTMNDRVNSLILYLSKINPFRSDLDFYFIRAVMVFTFYIFSYQKWFSFEAHQIEPFICTARWSSG